MEKIGFQELDISKEEQQLLNEAVEKHINFIETKDFSFIEEITLKLIHKKYYNTAYETLISMQIEISPESKLVQNFKHKYNALMSELFDRWKEESQIRDDEDEER